MQQCPQTTTGSSGTGTETYTNTVTLTLTDTRNGFAQGSTWETSKFDGKSTDGSCTSTTTMKGSGRLPTLIGFAAFGAPAAAAKSGPYFIDYGGVAMKGSTTGCGSSEPATGQSPGFTYCTKAGQSRYGSAAEATLIFACSQKTTFSNGSHSLTGTGTLTATGVNACGLWTTGCSISAAERARRR